MSKKRRRVKVNVITTPNENQKMLPLSALNNFKRSVSIEAKYAPEENAIYRGFRKEMSSVKVR